MSRVITLDVRTLPGSLTSNGTVEAPAEGDIARGTVHTLPEGARLLDYEIVAPIGEGGFGIVYLAWDRTLEQHVAIKEYLPAVQATRASVSPAVVVKSQRHNDSFRAGLRSFVNEGRMLARFDHPSLVRVLHLWEGNGTAYMAMPYYAGPTFERALAELGRPPDEAELVSWLRPLLDALGMMHAASCFHRDIAPDNILLTDNGPVLLDFGAARQVLQGPGPSPTVLLKPGFAPIEQYGAVDSMQQGPWTDLYALASVVYMAITGHPPTPSIERLINDRLRPLSELARGRYSAPFLEAIDAALSLHPSNRPQSTDEFWTQLSRGFSQDEAAGDDAMRPSPPQMAPPPERSQVETTGAESAAPPARASSAAAARMEAAAPTASPWRATTEPVGWHGRRAAVLALAVIGLLLGLAAVGYLRLGDPVVIAPPPQPKVEAPPAEAAAPEITQPPVPEPTRAPDPTGAGDTTERKPEPARVSAPDATPEPEPEPEPEPQLELAPAPAPAPPAANPARQPALRASVEPERTPRREARRSAGEQPAATARRVAPPVTPQGRAQCADLLQRASLGPLEPDELALLKKECE